MAAHEVDSDLGKNEIKSMSILLPRLSPTFPLGTNTFIYYIPQINGAPCQSGWPLYVNRMLGWARWLYVKVLFYILGGTWLHSQ